MKGLVFGDIFISDINIIIIGMFLLRLFSILDLGEGEHCDVQCFCLTKLKGGKNEEKLKFGQFNNNNVHNLINAR